MELDQEEALHEFLDNATEPFTLDEITLYTQVSGQRINKKLAAEIDVVIKLSKALNTNLTSLLD